MEQKELIMPPFLHPGDRVVILSPSSRIEKAFLKGAAERLASWGLQVQMARHADGHHASYAGTIAHRAEDLQQAMDDLRVKAILCSRGGYGAVHLLDRLDFSRMQEHPKWLIGFSDITALHCLWQKQGIASLHAPMARHLTVEPADDEASQALHDILFGITPSPAYTCPTHPLNRTGSAQGTLRGGNFAVFHGLHGTPYDIPSEGTILFIEDVGERPHAVERMMYNLKLAGVFDRISGLVVGQFTEYEDKGSLGKDLYGALADVVKGYDFPVCFDFPVGHVVRNLPLITGARARLEVGRKEIKLTMNPQETI